MSEEDRKRMFKKALSVDDARRKRETQRTQIRKRRLQQSLAKRRRRGADDDMGGEEEGGGGGMDAEMGGVDPMSMAGSAGASYHLPGPDSASLARASADPRVAARLKYLPKWCQDISSGELDKQVYGTVSIRRLLSIEGCPPIDEVVHAGVVPRLVEFLDFDANPVLQFEAAWALTNIASGSSEHTQEVLREGALPIFVRLLSSESEDVREQCIWALGNIAGDSIRCRDMVIKDGALPLLVANLDPERNKIGLVRNGVWTLSNLCRSKPPPPFEQTRVALPVLGQLVYMDDDEDILVDTLWSLSYLSDGQNDQIEQVLGLGIVRRLVDLLMHPSVSVVTPALRTVGNIVTGDDLQTQAVINVGALNNLSMLLDHERRTIRKEACWTISNITAGRPEQIQSVIERELLEPIVRLLHNDDFEVQKEAAWVISNATAGGTNEQINFLVEIGSLEALCTLLTVEDVRILMVALEGLENILRVGRSLASEQGVPNHYADRVEQCEGLSKLEGLQRHPRAEVYAKVSRMLEDYFEVEAEEDAAVAPEEEGDAYGFGAGDASFTGFSRS